MASISSDRLGDHWNIVARATLVAGASSMYDEAVAAICVCVGFRCLARDRMVETYGPTGAYRQRFQVRYDFLS